MAQKTFLLETARDVRCAEMFEIIKGFLLFAYVADSRRYGYKNSQQHQNHACLF